MKNNNKIIFLDFDGVIVTPRAAIAKGAKGVFRTLDVISCELIEQLLEKDVSIVISSTWRIGRDLNSIHDFLGSVSWKIANAIHRDWKTRIMDGPRGLEIAEWLERHPEVETFIILDDDTDMAHLKDRLIKCDPYDGLGLKGFLKARKMLNENDSASTSDYSYLAD